MKKSLVLASIFLLASLMSLNSLALDKGAEEGVAKKAADASKQEEASDSVKTSEATPGRIIGYLPGWKTPPDASAIKNAGYTHIIIAFGVFSTANPGEIVPVFDTVSKEYIQSLQDAGVVVLLSLGGAASSVPDTTVNFHQVLTAASSPDEFKNTFMDSVSSLVNEYGFQGIDIDIESGLNGEGSFSEPTGDIAVLADIINTLHANNDKLLITLAPQIANISATSGFDATWGNYASLVMQTYESLEWVGVQLYNSGCAFGINLVCYDPNNTNSPDASVALPTDLLEDWPAQDSSGRATGFQPYISKLKPSQVVLGYPAPNAEGVSDGAPAAVIPTIKRAIQCLRTGVQSPDSCDTYIPPRTYPDIGGVFEWEITYDENNNFKFAEELMACVMSGDCSQ